MKTKAKQKIQKILSIAFFALMFNTVNLHAQWEMIPLEWDYLTSGTINGSDIYIGGFFFKGVFYSNDQGKNWETRGLQHIRQLGPIAANGKYVFAATVIPAGKIYRTSDKGYTWDEVLNTNISNCHFWAMSISGKYVFAGSYKGLYMSSNLGETWIMVPGTGNANIASLETKGSNIYYSDVASPGIKISTNYGADWTSSLSDKIVYSLSVQGEKIFAGTEEDGLFISDNNGDSWYQSDLMIPSIITISQKGNIVLAASFDWNSYICSVFKSTDKGQTWNEYNDGFYFDDAYIYNFLFVGEEVFTVTDWYSVWKRPLNGRNANFQFISETRINSLNKSIEVQKQINRFDDIIQRKISEKEKIKEIEKNNIKLFNNYPNPFNPSTKISYELPVSGTVKLTIYNSIGQTVAELVNSVQNAGRHEVEWNASAMPSGMYFYRIETGSFTETKKMMLIK